MTLYKIILVELKTSLKYILLNTSDDRDYVVDQVGVALGGIIGTTVVGQVAVALVGVGQFNDHTQPTSKSRQTYAES